MTQLAALLQPLQPPQSDTPCGEDLAYSGSFDVIARAREHDDPALAQGAWAAPLKVADWPAVARTAEELLLTRSKDLRLAAWWAEAQACLRGWRGLADGLLLAEGLVRQHWAGLHPRPDEGTDHEPHIGALAWLLKRAATLAPLLPLPLGRAADGHAELRLSLAELARLRAPADAQAGSSGITDPGPERLARVLRDTPAAIWREQLAGHEAARAALHTLELAVDAHLGADGPGFRAAADALDRAGTDLLRLAREAGWQGAAATAGLPPTDAAPPCAPAAVSTGPVRHRQDAVQRLREIAAWFRQAEPHSPAGYLADQAARWADLPLHEWLRAVLKDGGALTHVEELLGLGAAPAAPAE